MYIECPKNLNKLKNKNKNSKIQTSIKSNFFILIFKILEFRNIDRSIIGRFKYWPPPKIYRAHWVKLTRERF